MSLDTAFWLRLIGTLAVENAVIVGSALLVQWFIRSGAWKRTVWQIAIVSLLLLTVSEMSGLGRGMSVALLGKTPVQQKQHGEMSFRVSDGPAAPMVLETPKTTAVVAAQALPQKIRWPGAVWILGIGVVLGRIVLAQALLFCLRFRWPGEPDPQLNLRVAQLGKRLGMTRRVRLLRVPGLTSPIAFGWLRPCIGLPGDFKNKFTANQQDTMLAHELGHLAAHDPLWYAIADVTSACLWWLPFAWMARRNFQWASELAADEASFVLEDGAGTLAECLVGLAREGVRIPRWAWMGITGNKSNFGQRVERLLQWSYGADGGTPSVIAHRWPFTFTKAALTAFTALALVLGAGWLRGEGAAKPGTLRASLRESWDQSPGAVMVMAALEKRDIPVNSQEPAKAPTQLYTKTFKIDPERLLATLRMVDPGLTNRTADYVEGPGLKGVDLALRSYLARAGVDLDPPGKSIFVKMDTGVLQMRGGLDDLATIEKLAAESWALKPQVTIEIQFVDIDEVKEVGLDWILEDVANPDPLSGWKVGDLRAIVTESRRDALVTALQAYSNIASLRAPRITTLSGRQAHIVFSDSDGTQQIGRSVDLIPEVQPDMRTIHLVAVPQVYAAALPTNGLPGTLGAFSVDLYDGQTVVVAQKGTKNWSVAFIKVDLIDQAGNRWNSLNEIPFTTNSIPQQPPQPAAPKPSSLIIPRKAKLSSALAAFQNNHAETAAAAKAGSSVAEPLVQRMFVTQQPVSEVALKNFDRRFPGTQNERSLTNAHNYLRAYIKKAGVKLESPKSLIVNDRNGLVLAHCASNEMAIVEEAVFALNQRAPQVEIEARVLEIDSKNRSAFDTLLKIVGIELTQTPMPGLIETANALNLAKVRESQEVTNSLTDRLTGVLSESQFQAALEVLTKKGNADFLAAPKVTTISDREVDMASLDFYYPAKLGQTVLQPLPAGVVVEFLPHIADDRSVDLSVTSTATHVVRLKSKPAKVQVCQVSDARKIEVGKTMVLCGLSGKDAKRAEKDLVVFVTPRVIDTTGNQIK